MQTPTQEFNASPPEEFGLDAHLRLVLDWHSKANKKLSVEAVHQLRKSVRRCRSMADSLVEVDSDPRWKRMKKAPRKMFRALGHLRDLHVMMDWLDRLAPKADPAAKKLTKILTKQEKEKEKRVRFEVRNFDRKKWKKWTKKLPRRANRVPEPGQVYSYLALQRYQEAHEMHRLAMRKHQSELWHQLRITVKRLRYTIENFLPTLRERLGPDLERVQDTLGEVHDLDVLWELLQTTGKVFNDAERKRWQALIEPERKKRLEEYKALSQKGLWRRLRRSLPAGKTLEQASWAWLRAWASFHDPDFSISEMQAEKLIAALGDPQFPVALAIRDSDRDRSILYAAALLQGVATTKKKHGGGLKRIKSLTPPLDWDEEDWDRVLDILRVLASPDECKGKSLSKKNKTTSTLAEILKSLD